MLRARKRWLAVALLLVATSGVLIGVYRYKHRFVRSGQDLLGLLPRRNATVFFADIAALRRTGYLQLLAGAKRTEEPEYAEFVHQTGFDYTKDADEIAAAAKSGQIFSALRGRVQWARVWQYMTAHGTCKDDFCQTPASTPGRWVSIVRIQPDVIGLAVSGDPAAAKRIRPASERPELASSAPVWIMPSRAALTDTAELPMAIRVFAISLQSADSLVLSLQPANQTGEAFEIQIDATFANAATADTARTQLEIDTQMLKRGFARERQLTGPADFTGLLTGGTFQVRNRNLTGSWPVRQELLASIR